jgi:hypothetical protein
VSVSYLCRSGSKMGGKCVCVVFVPKWKQDGRKMCLLRVCVEVEARWEENISKWRGEYIEVGGECAEERGELEDYLYIFPIPPTTNYLVISANVTYCLYYSVAFSSSHPSSTA